MGKSTRMFGERVGKIAGYTYKLLLVYFIKNPVEYHPACWVDENRFAEGE
jgi:hypothetical protein